MPALIAESINQGDVKATFFAGIHQKGGSALTVLAEMKIKTSNDAACRQAADQNPVDKYVRSQLRKLAGEMAFDHCIKAQCFEN